MRSLDDVSANILLQLRREGGTRGMAHLDQSAFLRIVFDRIQAHRHVSIRCGRAWAVVRSIWDLRVSEGKHRIGVTGEERIYSPIYDSAETGGEHTATGEAGRGKCIENCGAARSKYGTTPAQTKFIGRSGILLQSVNEKGNAMYATRKG